MKNKVVLQPEEITVFLFNEVKNLNVKIIYIFINPYQLTVKEATFFSNKNLEINTVDIRQVNYYSVKKKGLKLINNIVHIDKNHFYKGTYNNLYHSIDLKKIALFLSSRKTKDKNLKFAAYAYYYVLNTFNYSANYSLFLSKKLNYSDSYIKNLTKEIFKNKFITKNVTGTPGGILTPKTIRILNSQKFQQFQ